MSCSQITAEFSSQKFRLIFEHPSAFGSWRYTCCPNNRSYYIYRVLFASLIILLVILDFFWIIGFAGAGETNRINACFDASQLNLVLLSIAYFLLSCSAFQWARSRLEPHANHSVSYKFAWLLYTCTLNAIYTCMIIFWISGGASATIEQQLKNSIPGILVFIDLCVNSLPLYLCHVIYVILFYFIYLAVAALGLFCGYTFGSADKNQSGPSNPTAWVAGHPLLPNGFGDFTDPHRIVITIFGSVALAIMVHCILLAVVITRDFFASLFHRSTMQWMSSVDGVGSLQDQPSSSTVHCAPAVVVTPTPQPVEISQTTKET